MIEEALFNKVRNILAIALFIFFIASVSLSYFFVTGSSDTVLGLLSASVSFNIFLAYSLGVIYAVKFKDHRKLRKVFKVGTLISVLLLVPGIVLSAEFDSEIVLSISVLGFILFMPSLLYILYDHKLKMINLILLGIFLIGFLFKRLHFPFASVLLFISCGTIASGMIIYMFNCILTIKNNLYLKLVASAASLLIAFGFLSVLFKYQHWPGASVLISSFYSPMVALTLIVLISLPSSGFISWPKDHRKVLTQKLLYLWIFILLFGSLRYILPTNTFNSIYIEEIRTINPFGMYDYNADDMNGLSEDSISK